MKKITYKEAGVDTRAGQRAVDLIKDQVKTTFSPSVLTDLGGFSGLFALDREAYEEPVLVSGTDGVGTKLKIAFLAQKHRTVGIDCAAMCINDILCQGAKPLFFLDYIATGKVKPEKIQEIVSGFVQGCRQAKTALIGGETAEMPDMYHGEDYDLAGFCVGVVEKKNIITGKNLEEGDVILGLPSSGLHSNGYSLVRKLLLSEETSDWKLDSDYDDFLGEPLEDVLLRPTKIYYHALETAKSAGTLKGLVHITGGGFYENIPRILPDHLDGEIDPKTWSRPPIFSLLKREGNLSERELFSTFNMGIGMVAFVSQGESESVRRELESHGEEVHVIGRVTGGKGQVKIRGIL